MNEEIDISLAGDWLDWLLFLLAIATLAFVVASWTMTYAVGITA